MENNFDEVELNKYPTITISKHVKEDLEATKNIIKKIKEKNNLVPTFGIKYSNIVIFKDDEERMKFFNHNTLNIELQLITYEEFMNDN